MRITLVQSEIEAAIQLYLGSQMTIAKGVSMTIELRATRGDEGYMAMIDIKPGQPQYETIARAETRSAPIHAATEAVSEAAEEDTAEEDSSSEEAQAPFDPDPAKEQAAAMALTDSGEKAEKPTGRGGRSLFGGLKKPVNAVN